MNSQKFTKEIYPENYTEEDKERFDLLIKQGKLLFPNLVNDEWLIKSAIHAYMLKEKLGDVTQPTEEEINAIKSQYTTQTVFYTPEIETKE